MPYLNLDMKTVPLKPVPVVSDTVLRIKFYSRFGQKLPPQAISVVFRNYFESWRKRKIVVAPVKSEDNSGMLELIQKLYESYLRKKQPFVPRLVTLECDCGATKLNKFGACDTCKAGEHTRLIELAMWQATIGRAIIKTVIKPMSPLKQVEDILKLDWYEDAKISAIKSILEIK